jgi:hypothetical protein
MVARAAGRQRAGVIGVVEGRVRLKEGVYMGFS